VLSLYLAVLLSAPEERLHVEWVAPEGCPSRDTLAASLTDSVPPNRTFHASVRIDEPRQDGQFWQAVVVTTADGDERTRVVKAPDCERVTEAAVLVITLAATSLPKEPNPPPTPTRVHAPQSSSSDAATSSGTEKDTPPPPTPFTYHLRVQPQVGANVGMFPLPGVSWGVSLAFVTGQLRLQLAYDDGPGVQGSGRTLHADLQSVTLRSCWLFAPADRLQLGPCTGLAGARMVAAASGVALPQPTGVGLVSILAGATAGLRLSKSVSPWVAADVGVNLVRPRFLVTTQAGDETVYSLGWLHARLTLGVEVDLSFP
jgi:hypothetical protein